MEILARWFSQDFHSFLSSVTDPPFKENETRLGQQTVSVE